MKSISLIMIFSFLIICNINCSKERELTTLEYKLLVGHLERLQFDYRSYVEQGGRGSDVPFFMHTASIANTIPDAQAMILYPDGKVFVHSNVLYYMNKKLDDEHTKKALNYRNTREPLLQKWTSGDGRTVMDISLPVMDDSNPPEFKGIVRIALYLDI